MSLQFPVLCNLSSYWSTLGSLGGIWNGRCLLRSLPCCLLCLLPCSRAELAQRQAIIFKRNTNLCESQREDFPLGKRKLQWNEGIWNDTEMLERTHMSPYSPSDPIQSLKTYFYYSTLTSVKERFEIPSMQQQVQRAKPSSARAELFSQHRAPQAGTTEIQRHDLHFPCKTSSRNQLTRWECWKPAAQWKPPCVRTRLRPGAALQLTFPSDPKFWNCKSVTWGKCC